MQAAAYLRRVALSATLCLGLIWAWVACVPMAFMESEYAAWQAKLTLLDRCDLGPAIILGDSRAAADIMPNRLPFRVTNLALGGGEAIEALSLLHRALRCPQPPSLAILSFGPAHFTQADLFWQRTVRFGLLSPAEIAALRATSTTTGDASIYAGQRSSGIPTSLRDQLSLWHFPRYAFPSLLHGGVFLRWWHNNDVLAQTLAARGQYSFGTAPGSNDVAQEGHMTSFTVLPVLDRYFNQLLATLQANDIETLFIAMPINDATWQQIDPALYAGFAYYLAGYQRRYPHFHVAAALMPHRPNQDFGDQFCHLNPAAAEKFSDELAQRLQAAPPSTQNEAQNGWFSETGRAASAKVAPISKRGS
jgi:hypothetical protein